jgi:hypothetical protein
MKNLSVLSLLAMVALLAGCAGETTVSSTDDPATPKATGESTPEAAETVAADNGNCPIMGHAVTADGGTFAWNGKTIGFCCEGCKPEFEKLSDEDKTAKLAEADKADHSGDTEDGEEKPAETTES